MKILIIKDAPGEIKVQRMTYNIQEIGLAVALRKKGHECDVMSISDDGIFHEQNIIIEGQNITVYSVEGIVVLKNGWFKKKVYPILDRYDIIQACEYNQMFTRHLAKKYKDKMICYHGPYYCKFNRNYNLMAKIFDLLFIDIYKKLNTCFITKSELAKQYLLNKGVKNVHTIGVGLSEAIIGGHKEAETLPEIEQIKQIKCIKLLYIGIIEPRRNSLFLLELIHNLKNRGLEFKLILIGKYKDNAYRKTFEDKIQQLSLEDNIFYIPKMEQKYLGNVYAISHIFLLPTIYDIYGMVLLEAMYFGISTITTVNGGSNVMIEDGKNGYIMTDFDMKKWTDKVFQLVENPELRNRVGHNAHETICNGFTWEKLAPKFIEIYNNKIHGNL